jgi:mRNA interferase RelE/StbE
VYRIEMLPSAVKELARLPRHDQEAVSGAIDGLADNPYPAGSQKLKGNKNPALWRVRSGDYRIIYQIEREEIVVLIVKIGHRREVYRGR